RDLHVHLFISISSSSSPLFFFFFLILPPPPISTLFPYTTLFRSFDLFLPICRCCFRHKTSVSLRASHFEPAVQARNSASGHALQDRKSTRLNSSHVAISYAVFCLKKKKKNKSNIHEQIYNISQYI